MTRGKKNKTISNNNIRNEIIGMAVVTVSLLLGLSLYFKSLGNAGKLFRLVFLGTFGLGAYILPVVIFLIGSVMIINRGRINIRRRFWAACLALFNLLLILHVTYSYGSRNLSFIDKLENAYIFGISSKGGGILCELVDIPLVYIFDKVGTYILLVCVTIIFIILATEISIGDMINSFISKIKNRKKKEKIGIVEETAVDTEPKIKENEEPMKQIIEDNIENTEKKIKILDFLRNSELDEGKEPPKEQPNENSTVQEAKEQPKSKNTVHNGKDTEQNESKSNISEEVPKNEAKKIEYIFPTLDLLSENKNKGNNQDKKELLNNAKIIEDTLQSFGVEAKVVQVSRGPAVTRYELHPSPGVKVSRIVNLSDDIALNLAAPSVRIEAPIPGKAAVGIEVPNREVVPVTLKEVLESTEFTEFNSRLAFALGKDIGGKCIVTDLSKMPHLLIAGATGSGKSVCINTLITSLIYKSSPDDVKMLMIDPKVVELSVYNGVPHLLIPVVTDPKKASSALFWAVNEMTQRYKTFADNNVRNIESYNKLMDSKSPELKMPQIVIIIDELADLMMVSPNEVEDTICRLAQMARAAGMHLVIATQRPSVDVITGVIKANIPSRISFAVSSQIDSRTILDMSGAEKLLGKGDMLFLPLGESKPVRIQGAFISEKEVERVVEFLKDSLKCDYDNNIIEEIECKSSQTQYTNDEVDELLPEAIRIGVEYGQVSASMLQRRLRVGFNRAARLVEEMEARGIVGPQDGSKPRQILISKEELEDNL